MFFIGVLWAIIGGFSAHSDCIDRQAGSATFQQVQIVTLLLYPFWVFLPIVFFKINDFLLRPDVKDEEGNYLYGSWTHKQYVEEEEEEDDWTLNAKYDSHRWTKKLLKFL